MDERFKEIGLKYGLTQSQTKQLFNYQFKFVADNIRDSVQDILVAKDVKLPLLGTFYRSLYVIKNLYKNGSEKRRESAPEKAAKDGYRTGVDKDIIASIGRAIEDEQSGRRNRKKHTSNSSNINA